MKENPLIFVTNDDGIGAKGLWSIVDALRDLGRVVVVAPEYPQSGKSQSITMYRPLNMRTVRIEENLEVYACTGTPVDCVKMAFDHLLVDRFPDITVSGINHGSNSAVSVLYSGTVGAAIEASFYRKPSVGLSLLDHNGNADFSVAVEYSVDIVKSVLNSNIELPLCLNVNIPAVAKDEIKGIKVCRQTRGYWKEKFVEREDPRGDKYYWLTGDFFNEEPDNEETDEWALKNNYVSVVPVQTDMTNHNQLKELDELL